MRKRRLKIYYHILAFIICSAFLSIGLVMNSSFNSKTHHIEYTSEEVFAKENSVVATKELKVNVFESTSPTYEPWEVTVEDGSGEENNYKSLFVEFEISNVSNTAVKDYQIKFTSENICYFVTGWCGSYEFHQFRNDSELVQKLTINDDNPKPQSDDYYNVETINEDHLVAIAKGDYFIYTPSLKDGMAPLSIGQSVTPGMLIVESKKTPANLHAEQITADALASNSVEANPADISFHIESRGDAWVKTIDYNNEGVTEPNFLGQTYDILLKNSSKYTMNKYNIKFIANETMYISSCWNGGIEIHQGINVEFIKDLRKYSFKNSILDYIESGNDRLIVLNKGDYFIYEPSGEYYETPLVSGCTVNPGIILYQQITDDDLDITVDIEFTLYKNLLLNPFFDASVIGFIALFLSILFNLLLHSRVSSLVSQKEHDEKIIVESIETFIGFIDAKDPYTNGHSHRVAHYTRLLAENMGIHDEEAKRIYYIALLHDCGKIGIPDSILTKPSKLTPEEYEIIKKHPSLGADVLKNFTSIEGVRDGVLYHHERYDGTGYPTGKAGKDIPLEARIICVADSVDAMNSDRCYRKKLSKEEILSELKNNRGTQFDPDAVDAMIELIVFGKIKI